MWHGRRVGLGAVVLLVAVSAAGWGDAEGWTRPSASHVPAPTAVRAPAPPGLPETGVRIHTVLTTSVASGADAPGSQGLMLVDSWSAGGAYAWETRDRRWCTASMAVDRFLLSACSFPMAVGDSRGMHWLGILFTRHLVYLFGADNQQVTSVTCAGKPLRARRVGTVAHGARTLYAVRFPHYVGGRIEFSLSHDGTTSRASVDLGGIGDHSCSPAP